MARPLRLIFPGALYHVYSRGNWKNDIFIDGSDRRLFLATLAETVARHNWICHAFCLMGNHYHLIVETPDGNLSMGMRYLNGIYTQKFNYAHGKCGHLFQGRFKANLVDKANFLVTLSAYVVINPVKKRYVAKPEDWPWSSYAATLGLRPKPRFLTCDLVLGEMGLNKQSARENYRKFVQAIINDSLDLADLARLPLIGNDDFIRKYAPVLDGSGSLSEVPRKERLAGRPTLASLFEGMYGKMTEETRLKRAARIRKAFIDHGYRIIEIARFLNLHYTTVSKIVNGVINGVRS